MRYPKKVLVANRGEIAVRVVRACHEVGTQAVAVYSEVDRGALHVRIADEAYAIGEAPAASSYLNIERVVAAAKSAGCDAVHPGYGFLSENPDFAEAVERAGLTFCGPRPDSMRLMGNKVSARKEAIAAGVPVAGGSDPVRDLADLEVQAERIGFPLILKAARGGGGKGIRVVREPKDLVSAHRLATSEAKASFGSDQVFVERFLENARHVEIQVLGDAHGNVVHLGERECSLQRRQQKLVEETPSPSIDEETRRTMGAAAVALAKRIGYRSAGTLEFLVEKAPDGKWSRFFFMEMNMRLQVEHPVTELVTNIDLVKEQLRISTGEKLGYAQEDIAFRGAAIEVRLNAEDPAHDYMPSAGRIEALQLPTGPGTRLDAALYVGDQVSLFYDPLVAKLSVRGRTRLEAVQRMRRALAELRIAGIATTAPLLRRLLDSEEFERADFHIHFLEPFTKRVGKEKPAEGDLLDAAMAAAVRSLIRAKAGSLHPEKAGGNGAPADEVGRWTRYGRAAQLGRLDAL
jgi:acetyl-CoA carboxylase biotin carboxylase subunit